MKSKNVLFFTAAVVFGASCITTNLYAGKGKGQEEPESGKKVVAKKEPNKAPARRNARSGKPSAVGALLQPPVVSLPESPARAPASAVVRKDNFIVDSDLPNNLLASLSDNEVNLLKSVKVAPPTGTDTHHLGVPMLLYYEDILSIFSTKSKDLGLRGKTNDYASAPLRNTCMGRLDIKSEEVETLVKNRKDLIAVLVSAADRGGETKMSGYNKKPLSSVYLLCEIKDGVYYPLYQKGFWITDGVVPLRFQVNIHLPEATSSSPKQAATIINANAFDDQ